MGNFLLGSLFIVLILFFLLGAFGTWCALVQGSRCESEYRENNSHKIE